MVRIPARISQLAFMNSARNHRATFGEFQRFFTTEALRHRDESCFHPIVFSVPQCLSGLITLLDTFVRAFSIMKVNPHDGGRMQGRALELKQTINLPKTSFSMKANLPQNEPKWLAAVGQGESLRADSRGAQGRADFHPARRPALRQRAHPSGHGAQQDPEGLHREDEDPGGLQHALPAGLGLPRLAD